MKHLYAPWRQPYIKAKNQKPCVFCIQESAQEHDVEAMIIKRYTTCFVILNRFPYNGGHLLVIPYEHRPLLTDFPPATLHEIMEVVTLSTGILTEVLGAEGFNVGINAGGVSAGGSIPEHLHVHVLPRWSGDTGFLTTLADTKPISVDLVDMYKRIKSAFS